jgi:hypothetical protein
MAENHATEELHGKMSGHEGSKEARQTGWQGETDKTRRRLMSGTFEKDKWQWGINSRIDKEAW